MLLSGVRRNKMTLARKNIIIVKKSDILQEITLNFQKN